WISNDVTCRHAHGENNAVTIGQGSALCWQCKCPYGSTVSRIFQDSVVKKLKSGEPGNQHDKD
ncbi:TPA: hypothetical protein MHP62_28200, partial [Klebsiella pneumoniae subsp. pneumoniae]|nr:hypothetical protein [Klebsiella pneumoniae subsp. pneumoniae]HBX1568432.1 hypothetical protein [Klebsiella pneumoniae subsp. pneumoniae]